MQATMICNENHCNKHDYEIKAGHGCARANALERPQTYSEPAPRLKIYTDTDYLSRDFDVDEDAPFFKLFYEINKKLERAMERINYLEMRLSKQSQQEPLQKTVKAETYSYSPPVLINTKQ